MIAIRLPFSMGDIIRSPMNPFIEHVIDHPILEIGSSCSVLRSEVVDWLVENSGSYEFKIEDGEHCLIFSSEADATAFKLRWL